jgi:hypothetical protein
VIKENAENKAELGLCQCSPKLVAVVMILMFRLGVQGFFIMGNSVTGKAEYFILFFRTSYKAT